MQINFYHVLLDQSNTQLNKAIYLTTFQTFKTLYIKNKYLNPLIYNKTRQNSDPPPNSIIPGIPIHSHQINRVISIGITQTHIYVFFFIKLNNEFQGQLGPNTIKLYRARKLHLTKLQNTTLQTFNIQIKKVYQRINLNSNYHSWEIQIRMPLWHYDLHILMMKPLKLLNLIWLYN
ncbi:unnamed protein product [Paramecium octaurelia]|uniref:Uncharacterized protein n=1 Tax=Paramecium octaurelia TaxID=43137 RepID=A0A8S1XNT4_PAROT|nr:unnamed protein product [Paramecium octaurelia]